MRHAGLLRFARNNANDLKPPVSPSASALRQARRSPDKPSAAPDHPRSTGESPAERPPPTPPRSCETSPAPATDSSSAPPRHAPPPPLPAASAPARPPFGRPRNSG